jgi:hypothetical protein
MTLAERWVRDSRERWEGLRGVPSDGGWRFYFSDGTEDLTDEEHLAMAKEVERIK